MSYLVLARKYRPTNFNEVVGQEHVTRTLANAFTSGRVHHAFLFCGPRGVGKTTLARIVGKALNCERGPTAEPCGVCSACETITSGTAVDYFEMDGASNRGIDSIRELTEAVRYQPAVLRKKVYVIDEVHMLTTEAFNALLKTLEEPPPHVSFVLATTEPHKIPNTILSRCQRYDFKLVPAQQLSAHLTEIFKKESLDVEPGAISLLVRESGGSVRDAVSLCDQIISYVGGERISEAGVAEVLGVADRSLTRTLVMALADGDARVALEAVDAAVDRGVDEVQLARAIVRYLRDLAVMQVAPDAESLVEGSAMERAELATQASSIDRGRVIQMFDRMLRACNDLGETQQPRLVLDLALIDVAALEPLIPLGDLIDRLGALERRLTGGGRGGGAPGGSGGRPSRRAPAAPRQAAGTGRADAAAPAGAPASAAPVPAAAAPAPAPVAPVSAAPADASTPVAAAPAPPRVAAPAASSARVAVEPGPAAPPGFSYEIPPPDDADFIPAATHDDALGIPGLGPVAGPAPDPQAAAPASASRESAPAPPADELAEWESVLGALDTARKMSLYGLYEHAKILRWDAAGIELGYAPDVSSVAEMAAESSNLQPLKEFLQQRYGRAVDVRVRALSSEEASSSPRARSVVDMNRQRVDDERRRRTAELHRHPIYNKVVETFGAPVKEEINTNV